MKRHHFHFHFRTHWGFLRASIDLCVQENMCCRQSCLAAPGVLLLRAMAIIRELDEAKLDPCWIIVGPGLVSTMSHNGDFQWHIAYMHTGAILASLREWSKDLLPDRLDGAAAHYFWVPTRRLAFEFLLFPSSKFFKSFFGRRRVWISLAHSLYIALLQYPYQEELVSRTNFPEQWIMFHLEGRQTEGAIIGMLNYREDILWTPSSTTQQQEDIPEHCTWPYCHQISLNSLPQGAMGHKSYTRFFLRRMAYL